MVFNCVLVGVIGVIVGYMIIPRIFGPGRPHGEIRFFKIEVGEDPVMTAELYETPANICKRKYVVFKVSRS